MQTALAATQPSKWRQTLSPEQLRTFEVHGRTLGGLFRGVISDIAHTCAHVPKPRHWVNGLGAGRDLITSLDLTMRAACLVIADPTLPDPRSAIDRLLQVPRDYLRGLPQTKATCFREEWRGENIAQAQADNSLAEALIAIDCNDIGKMERAQADAIMHRGKLDSVIDSLGARIRIARAGLRQ